MQLAIELLDKLASDIQDLYSKRFKKIILEAKLLQNKESGNNYSHKRQSISLEVFFVHN